MAERVWDIFPETSLQLEFQAYKRITVVRYIGVTVVQNTLKLPRAYCTEIWRTRQSTLYANNIRPPELTSHNFYWWGIFKDQVHITDSSTEQEFKSCTQILESVCGELHINLNPFQ
jgi:hypothetical protein